MQLRRWRQVQETGAQACTGTRQSVGRDGTEGRIQKLPRQQLRNGRVRIK